ncbi:hypothetical protein K493DRAFT_311005 [Basidiobolus meristosporus CBS 931.73]|uniref:Phosphatidic acid phosphatase type 2/haloperoxidase domain-containing protein n=1 Tax=Basidiobolus meristosporus CBS 931.73 TaxID=1314790 RepID=A0A1Y1Z4Y3_9FUNG|nr:hypothetical protein K493DRAFT_311005 [Basidiobolus meristosporus CBS 931.73]|eukprot:ORY05331.1 hypothetical protein K493DRAFT_311005 [Basidiobolus meristosporus CBS 931.73]
MPSSHSQNTAFFTSYFNLYLARQTPTVARTGILLLANGFLLLILWSRVNFKHHTWEQVLVGLSVGVFMGFGWFTLWSRWVSAHLQGIRYLVDYGLV